MASKYVPPHMRNSNKVVPVVEAPAKPSIDEFPTLGNAIHKPHVVGEKTFANMAATWAKDADEKTIQENAKKADNDTLEILRRRRMFPLPEFHNIRRFVEEYDEGDEEDEVPSAPVDPDEQGWIEVRSKKKPRKQKSFEDEMNRPPTPDETAADETVWNSHEDGDTYWK